MIKTSVATRRKKCLMGVTGLFHTSGGIAAVNRSAVLALSEERYQLDIFSLIENDTTVDERYVNPSLVRVDVSNGSKVRFSAKLWQAAVTRDYDLVIIDHINLASALAPMAKLRRLRYAVWLFGAELFPPRPDFEGKLGLRSASKRLAISPYIWDRFHAQFPDLPAEICDLALDPVQHKNALQYEPDGQNGPDLALVALDGREHMLGDQVILHVGRIPGQGRDKGQKVLLQALPQILEQHPDAQLALIGDGDGRPELINIARTLSEFIHPRIFIPGFADDDLLDLLYRTCSLFAMPSRGEGFGLVYLEAMSRGKPCLGARVDATPYIVRDGETGLLVDNPESPEEVAACINWLLAHPAEAAAMGVCGYNQVRRRHLFPQFKERLFAALST